ncbi:hypothetical protein [[Clostridium] colinum]|uniref:hypothetical protein n=1 Tax=[Clostridium] colinum TaxID=36835 RepID=UPI0020256B84|nr:hypothetical protein [[Clostridium] colinum]
MALGVLLILFISLVVISGLGTIFLFLSKNKKFKNIIFYILAILSMIISILSATSVPTNFVLEQVISLLFGLLGAIAIVINIKLTNSNISYILVVISIVLGILKLFSFI